VQEGDGPQNETGRDADHFRSGWSVRLPDTCAKVHGGEGSQDVCGVDSGHRARFRILLHGRIIHAILMHNTEKT